MLLDPPWLAIARGEIGIRESPGHMDHPRIRQYHAVTAAGEAPDAVPWCSSFVCWCLEQSGIGHTRSKGSQSWVRWGTGVRNPIVGAIGVIRWRPWSHKGHVGLVVGVTPNGRVLLLGGNQGNEVSIKSYPRRKFRAFRWPSPPVVDDPGTSGTR